MNPFLYLRPHWCSAMLALSLTAPLFAQGQRVGDPAYAALLDGLLAASTPVITVDELANSKAVVLDARSRAEFDVSHLRGARWVGYDDRTAERVQDLAPNTAMVVYCSVGYRSGQVTDRLLAAGFTNVRNLYGGVFEWVNTGHAVWDANGLTQRVHVYNADWGQWLRRGIKVH